MSRDDNNPNGHLYAITAGRAPQHRSKTTAGLWNFPDPLDSESVWNYFFIR